MAGCRHGGYGVGVRSDITVIGDDPLVDGMTISVRMRRDFVVTDAARLMATARRIYLDLNAQATPDEAAMNITCAADALFMILEADDQWSEATEARLAARDADGLRTQGGCAQFVPHEPRPLSVGGYNCFRDEDLFALPPKRPRR